MPPPIPPEIGAGERLGRGVFSRRRAERAGTGVIRRDVFCANDDGKISINRMLLSPEEMDEIAETQRTDGRPFFGYAVLTADEAGRDGREIEASPTDNNPVHADIVLPADCLREQFKQKLHERRLANLSSWQPRV